METVFPREEYPFIRAGLDLRLAKISVPEINKQHTHLVCAKDRSHVNFSPQHKKSDKISTTV